MATARPQRYALGRYSGPHSTKPVKPDMRKFVNYWIDTALTQPKDEVTRVLNVDFNSYANSINHNTIEYDHRYFAMRRGQAFDIDIKLNQEYKAERDDIRLVFQFGKFPLVSKETDIELYLSTKEAYKGWNATVLSKKDNTLVVRVITPPTCYVGKWTLQVHTVVKAEGSITVHKFNHKPKVYILFNPWCKDDSVYMEDDEWRKEYVMSDTGIVYAGGSGWWPNPKQWNFAQFDSIILECAIYLLDERSYMKDTVRGNPVNVTRKLSALVNAQDDNGVLVGNWSGDYEGGTSPLKWTGSEDILEEYFMFKEPVSFGQCWVYSAVVTSLCRALGIPCRSVTNYDSAHDTDGSTTIDKYVDEEGDEIDHLTSDSVWNFHVWNDVWMTRPDLPDGYDGWQAIDATPQETSDGVYCMGPMPLKAIKEGETNLPYDGPFVFAEVNGDRLTWEVGKDNSHKLVDTDENSVGSCVATKKVGQDTFEDITNQYKHQEYGKRSRSAVERAKLRGIRPKHVVSEYKKDVTMDIKLPADKTEVGETLLINVVLKNTSAEKRTLKGKLRIVSQYYTGIVYRHIDTLDLSDTELKPGQELTIKKEVPADKYFKHLPDHCPIRISCFVKVLETGEPINKECNLHLTKPALIIKAPRECTVGKKVEVAVSFTNKLEMPLTDCELRIEGPGLQKPLKRKLKEKVPALGTFADTFEITPSKAGKRELCINFNSDQVLSINAAHKFTVME